MKQHLEELKYSTRGRGLYEITDRVQAVVRRAGIQTGLATLLIRHTSASLVIQENADPSVGHDLELLFARLAPDGDPAYRHDTEGPDDMSAHARSALTQVNLSIPIAQGALTLGTWQGIYLWEHRRVPHSRKVALHFVGE